MIPAKRYLVLSVDCEIFGNGTGDVKQHVTRPTERMAALCEESGLPLTVFVEMEELLCFRQYAAELKQRFGYCPATLIEKEVTALSRRGHDIQLHLHPEWAGAKLGPNGWNLHRQYATVDALFESETEVQEYVASRKQALEELTGSRVVAYRAGAFSAQPSRKLLYALKQNAIAIDSSVVRGLHVSGEFASYDYRLAPNKAFWRVSEDVAAEDDQGSVWEVPIASKPHRRIQQLTWRRLRAKFARHVPRDRQKEMLAQLGMSRNPSTLLRSLARRTVTKLDFHNLSPNAFRKWVRTAPSPAAAQPDILVAIGHSKEHVDDSAFGKIARALANEPRVEVVGFSHVAALLGNRNDATHDELAISSQRS